MSKVTLPHINAGYRSVQKLNQNLDVIDTAFDNTLSRDGTGPNFMEAELDMNGNKIINLGPPTNDSDAVRLIDIAGSSSGGGGVVTWTSVTGKPTTFTPTVEDTQDIVGAMVVAGTNVTTVYNDAAGTLTISASGGGSGGSTYFKTLKDYGSVEDGVTDDKTAIDAAIADTTTKRIYVEGTVATTNLITDLNKYFYGPGEFILTTSSNKKLPARFTDITSLPAQGTGADVNYYFSSDNSKIDAEYVRLGQPTGGTNFRQNLTKSIGGVFPYYEAATTPHFWVFQNYVGWSGINARTTGTITSGSTTSITLNNASHGISTGDTVGFVYTDGNITETKVVTVSSATISWTGALTQTYPTNTAVTKGFRTMNPLQYAKLDHYGGGDAYAHVARVTIGYTPLASQRHWAETSTGSIYGGDMAFTAAGNYATGIEIQYGDNGFDSCVISDVRSFIRTNDTGDRSCGWIGSYLQSTGTKAINAFHVVTGKADIGFDTTGGQFTNNAAISMATSQRIVFDSSQDASNTSKMGSTVLGYTFYGNVQGGTYINHKVNGGLDSRGQRLEVVINNVTSSAGYGTFNIRGSRVESHKTFTVYRTDGTACISLEPTANQINFLDAAGTDASASVTRFSDYLVLQGKAASGGVTIQDTAGVIGTFDNHTGFTGLYMNTGRNVMVQRTDYLLLDGPSGGRTGFTFDGTNVVLKKNGTVVATW